MTKMLRTKTKHVDKNQKKIYISKKQTNMGFNIGWWELRSPTIWGGPGTFLQGFKKATKPSEKHLKSVKKKCRKREKKIRKKNSKKTQNY